MNTIDATNYIRQQRPGQFRIPGDGKEPYARVNDQKLDSKKEQKKWSIFINDENFATMDKGFGASSTKLFDFDVGMRFKAEKISETKKGEKLEPQYDKGRKTQTPTEKEGIVDQLA